MAALVNHGTGSFKHKTSIGREAALRSQVYRAGKLKIMQTSFEKCRKLPHSGQLFGYDAEYLVRREKLPKVYEIIGGIWRESADIALRRN